MKMKISCIIGILFSGILSFAQTDYKTGTKNKDGYTSVYNTKYIPATSVYGSSTSITRYGLLDEKTQKVVLPVSYKMVYTSYEDGLYIVQDTMDNVGLYSAKTQKFLVKPAYNKIEAFSEGLAIVQKKVGSGYDYYYGAIDKNGKLIILDTFPYLGNCRDGLMNFKHGKKFGFIDKQNKIVIPAIYENMSTFSSGLAPAKSENGQLYGYINKENKFVIEPKYVDAEIFYEGYAEVYAEKGGYSSKGSYGADKIGLIDTKGNEVIPPIYKNISLKKAGGFFNVTKDDKQGLIDSTGKIILPLDNKSIGEFYGGIARVEKTVGMYGLVNNKGKWLLPADYYELNSLYNSAGYYAKKDGKYTTYDKNMKVIIAADSARRMIISKKNIAYVSDNTVKLYDVTGKKIKTINQKNIDIYGTAFYSNDDSLKVPYFKLISLYNLKTNAEKELDIDDLSDFNEEGIFAGKSGSKWTFYDFTGKKLSDKSFENAVNFSEGICALQETSYSKPYLADKSFNKIAELSTVFYGPYSEGLAMSKSQYGTLYYLDKTGKTQFSIYATDGGACKNGRIKIKDGDKFYFVDKSGKSINNTTYQDLGDFSDGLAGFKTNNKAGYIDSTGKIVISALFDEVSSFYNGTAIVKKDENYFLIDHTGRSIDNNKYLSALNPEKGTFPVKKATGFGLIDSKGKTIIDFKYDQLTSLSEGMGWVQKNKKWAIVNSTGTEITGFDYDGGTGFENGYAQVTKNKKAGLADKMGKLVLPLEYTQMSKVYKNTVITVKPNGLKTYSVK